MDIWKDDKVSLQVELSLWNKSDLFDEEKLYVESEKELSGSYEPAVCPECGSDLKYEVNETTGKTLTEEYQCGSCDYSCSLSEYEELNKEIAEKEYDRIKDKILIKRGWKIDKIPESVKERIIETIQERIM